MIGDLFNNNKRRDVCTREGQRMYMGRKYSVEKETGYLVCTTSEKGHRRKRLHEVLWEQKWGIEVPQGCVIHHLDWNKSHNVIENLVCLTIWEHEQVHNVIGGEVGKQLGYELTKNRVDGLPPDMI